MGGHAAGPAAAGRMWIPSTAPAGKGGISQRSQILVPIQIPAEPRRQPAICMLSWPMRGQWLPVVIATRTALVRGVPTGTKPLFREREYTDTHFLNRRWVFLRLPLIQSLDTASRQQPPSEASFGQKNLIGVGCKLYGSSRRRSIWPPPSSPGIRPTAFCLLRRSAPDRHHSSCAPSERTV